jgi:hypothetical protein
VGWEICADSSFKGQDMHKKNSQQLMFLSRHLFKCCPGKTVLNFYAIGEAYGEWWGDHHDAVVGFHRDKKEKASMKKGVS